MLGFIVPQRAGADDREFAPGWQRLEATPVRAGRRRLLHALLAFGVAVLAWGWFGKLDVVVVAEGRLVPRTLLKLAQPADAGVVREILVAEGATVLEGQPLVRLDGALVESSSRELRAELVRRELQRRRIDAELDGTPPARRAGDDAEAYAAALALHDANRRAQREAVAQEAAAVERLERELDAARATLVKLERVVPIVRSASERFAQLKAEGFVSELAALERERDAIERSQDLVAQGHTVAGLESALSQARTRLAYATSAYRARLHVERAQADAEIARIGEALARELHRADAVEIRAPSAGTVKDVAVHGTGTVVAAGTPLVTLVPAGDELMAEVLVRHEDAGFVQPGQAVRIKLASYSFQKYGTVDGQVVRIAPDATEPTAERPAAAGYRARIALAAQALPGEPAPFELVSGMLASAEILLGERRVVEYLMSPLRKAWSEAARER